MTYKRRGGGKIVPKLLSRILLYCVEYFDIKCISFSSNYQISVTQCFINLRKNVREMFMLDVKLFNKLCIFTQSSEIHSKEELYQDIILTSPFILSL